MRSIRATAAVLMACLIASPLAAAEPYTFTSSDNWAPYSSNEDPNNGILVQIVTAAFRASGREIDVEFVPWARAVREAQIGLRTGVIGDWYSKEREMDFIYSDPIMHNDIVFFAFSDRGISYRKLKDLRAYKVGVVIGNSFIETLTKEGLAIDYAKDFDINLKKLIIGRIDLIADEKLSTLRLLKESYPSYADTIVPLQQPIETNYLYLLVSRKTDRASAIVAEFNTGLKAIIRDGTMKKILDAYGYQ